MNNYNTNYEYKQINSAFIFTDPDYQRNLDMNRVKRIVSNFNPNLVNPPKVSYRDGKYYVFDGQHTLAALKMKNHNQNLMVACRVFRGLTKEHEAELFSKQNGISRNVEKISQMRALYIAHDVDIVEFVNLTEKAGLYTNFTKGKAENKIVCVGKAFQVYKATTAGEYVEIMQIIKEAWNGSPESLNKEIIGGVYRFYRKYKGEFKHNTLVKQLSKVGPFVIIREGKAMGNAWNGDMRFAIQIFNYYNKGLKVNKLEPKF